MCHFKKENKQEAQSKGHPLKGRSKEKTPVLAKIVISIYIRQKYRLLLRLSKKSKHSFLLEFASSKIKYLQGPRLLFKGFSTVSKQILRYH